MLVQIIIALTGGIAILLSQQEKKPEWKKYASILGLIGQPFWFYTTFVHEQWGIFILSFFYTYAWFVGFKNNWLTKKIEPS